MNFEDLAFADSLRALAGWNQTMDDWRRMLLMTPGGCFLAEYDGVPVGTATTLVYARELAWVGMLIVHPEYRRLGIGSALLCHCIGWLRQQNVSCIKLDATPLGKKVYDGLGFRAEWTFTRWERDGAHLEPPAHERSRSWRESDARLTVPLDSAAFGVSRQSLVEALARQCCCAKVIETERGRLAGYALLRPGARALYLGPAAASSAADGARLLEALLAHTAGERVFWDIPDQNTAAVECARQHGFRPQRPLTRMYLGENTAAGDPQQQFALAGPEVG
jgi:GNAT superfamily N-acetyltransferase